MRGNTKYGSNPYRGRPIPKGRIEWAVEQANSAAHASRLLNVDKNTFRKYAEMYDLYEGVKNKSPCIKNTFPFNDALIPSLILSAMFKVSCWTFSIILILSNFSKRFDAINPATTIISTS